ncbi:MAG: NAD(P)/FAD-dependent oxidoreductase [Spirochaetes bacterium]|nr:NAD(P)/FAD-dependent oxidoreductase [Spirochaetota bacterium]
MNRASLPHVVIIGAGFAGLWAARTLTGKPVRVTLVDRNNYHTFLPLLYQVGAAEIEPEQIAYPVRTLLRSRRNVSYIRAQVDRLDLVERFLLCNGQRVEFDYCIIATGSTTNFFGTRGADRFAFVLKNLDDSVVLRNHILSCFERAAYCADRERRRALLTFVIVGGGPTGIEFSGALAELIRGPLRKDFPALSPKEIRVCLVESAARVLSMFDAKSSAYTSRLLEKKGVEVLCGTGVKELRPGRVLLSDGSAVETETVVWTAGVTGERIASLDVPLGRGGRLIVDETLQVPGRRGCFIAGDLAYVEEQGRPLPMIAPAAVQQGRAAAMNILRLVRGGEAVPFVYRDKGAMVTIGRNAAVARIGTREFTGFWAWVIWLVIHLMNLIGFRNKLFVLMNWAWDYIVFEKSVRLILPSCCTSPGAKGCRMRRCGR